MNTSLVIPLNAPLREGTHPECICRTCKHIAADWSFCKPSIVESATTFDKYQVVRKCNGYEAMK